MDSTYNPFRTALLMATIGALTMYAHAWRLVLPIILNTIEKSLPLCRDPTFTYSALCVFRYLKLVVHLCSFWLCYKPTALPSDPVYSSRDCTVILPTVDPANENFSECIRSCVINQPGHIIIVTVGAESIQLCNREIAQYRSGFPDMRFTVLDCPAADKRRQIALGLLHVKTQIVALLDDHVFWPSANFLPAALAPFQDEKVGGVGTNKRVRKTETGFNMKSFWNMLGALYLERHNFEIRATNAIDGGVFVISGRTALYRSRILLDETFIRAFTSETFFFGRFGPLRAGDDNFITRWLVNHGHDIKIQYSDDALIETTLGLYPKFLSQCLRWSRTTWRSNTTSLFVDGIVWYRQPWSVYAIYLSSFFNFALFSDCALVWLLRLSPLYSPIALKALCAWIFIAKMIKVTPYFLRHPEDLPMLPGYILFTYFHSLIKLYSLLTLFNDRWCGRDLDAVNNGSVTHPPLNSNNDDADNGFQSAIAYDLQASTDTSTLPSDGQTAMFYEDTNEETNDHLASSDTFPRKVTFDIPLPLKQPSGRPSHRRQYYETPWGPVSPSNPHLKSANMLETQSSLSSPTPSEETSSISSESTIDIQPAYHPYFTRSTNAITKCASTALLPTVGVYEDWTDSSSEEDSDTDDLYDPFPSPYVSRPWKASHASLSTRKSAKASNIESLLTACRVDSDHTNLVPPIARAKVCSQPYGAAWWRGPKCGKLHSHDSGKLGLDNACLVEDVFNLPVAVVAGRPRM